MDDGGRRKGWQAHGHCFTRNLFDYPAGQEHANVVQDGVQVDSKDEHAQVGFGIKGFSRATQNNEQPGIDVQCRRGKDRKTGPQERQPLRPFQADLPLRTHAADFTQDFEDRSEEKRGHHARKSCVLCQRERSACAK